MTVGQKYKFFSCSYGDEVADKCFWFRFFGYGLHFKHRDARLLFSERYGYATGKVFFGVRVRVLKP